VERFSRGGGKGRKKKKNRKNNRKYRKQAAKRTDNCHRFYDLQEAQSKTVAIGFTPGNGAAAGSV